MQTTENWYAVAIPQSREVKRWSRFPAWPVPCILLNQQMCTMHTAQFCTFLNIVQILSLYGITIHIIDMTIVQNHIMYLVHFIYLLCFSVLHFILLISWSMYLFLIFIVWWPNYVSISLRKMKLSNAFNFFYLRMLPLPIVVERMYCNNQTWYDCIAKQGLTTHCMPKLLVKKRKNTSNRQVFGIA